MEVEARPVPSGRLRLAGVAVHAFLGAVWVLTVVVVAREAPDVWAGLWGLADLTTLVVVQLVVFSRPARPPSRRMAHLALAIQAVLVFAPYLQFGDWWIGNPGLLAGTVLLVLPSGRRVAVVGVVAAALGVLTFLYGRPGNYVVFQVVDPVFTGLVLYGLTRLAETVHGLRITHHELARLAVVEQRWMFARELQRRLGARLSAVMALAHRSVAPTDGPVPRPIQDALDITRAALADARLLIRERPGAVRETAPRPGHDRDLPQMSRRLANGVLASVLLGFGVVALATVVASDPGPRDVALAVLYVVALLALQLAWFGRPAARRRWIVSTTLLAVQAALVYLPVPQLGTPWLDLTGFLAGSMLLVLRPAVATPLAALVIGSTYWLEVALGNDALAALMQLVTTAITALVVYALTQLARLVGELQQARADLAQVAVAEERLRLSRDLHDLLGFSLSAIALKLELASRLSERGDLRAARGELDEVVALARRGLGDVRSVPGGDQDLQLDEELESARLVLASAGLDVRVRRDADVDAAGHQGPLALAVREGATNVLRHGATTWCALELRSLRDQLVLQVRNDGASPDPADDDEPGDGHGLANLTHRISRVGGTLTSGLRPDGVFELCVTVPVAGPPAEDEAIVASHA